LQTIKFISKYESPFTKSIKQASYLGKCYWFCESLQPATLSLPRSLLRSLVIDLTLAGHHAVDVIYHMLLSTTVLGWLAGSVVVDPALQVRANSTRLLVCVCAVDPPGVNVLRSPLYAVHAQGGATKLYVEAIGAFHQHRVFLTCGVIDMLHMFEGLGKFTRRTHLLTEEEAAVFKCAEDEEDEDLDHEVHMDRFFSEKFDFSRNYAETLAVFAR
jgi:hypothetical protein